MTRISPKFDRIDLLLIITLVLVYVVVAKLPFAPLKFGDGDFHTGAKLLAGALRHEVSWSRVGIQRLPGAVFYYTVPYVAMRHGSTDDQLWRAAFIWTMFWMAVALLLLRRTAALIAGESAGIWAAAVTLLSPLSVYYTYSIMAEAPGYVGAVIATYGFARQSRRDESKRHAGDIWVVVSGLSLLLLSRTNVVLLLVLGMVAACMLYRRKDERSRAQARFTAAAILASTCVYLAVTIGAGHLPRSDRNSQNENLAYVAFQGRHQYRTETWNLNNWDGPTRKRTSVDWRMWHERTEQARADARAAGVPFSRELWRITALDVAQHPVLNLKMAAVRAVLINVAFVNSRRPESFPRLGPISGRGTYFLLHIAVNAASVLLVVLSAMYAIRNRKQLWEQWFLWGPWLMLMLFHCAVYAEPRYLLPAKPGLCVMAGIVACAAWKKYRLRSADIELVEYYEAAKAQAAD